MNFRTYQFIKIKSYLKSNDLLLFSNGIRQNTANWIQTEQGLKKLNLIFYKTYNKLTIKVLKNSTFFNFTQLISGPFFFFKLKQKLLSINKNILFSEKLKSLLFALLALKLNNKLYSLVQLKNLTSLNYKSNMSLFYQYLLVHLKCSSLLTKSRNNVT